MYEPQYKKSKFGIDGLLIAVGLVGIAAALFFFLKDTGIPGYKHGELQPVGSIVKTQNDVRRRIYSGFTWTSIAKSDHVFEGDSIFTGEDSEASISLNSGGNINVDPKSLIVIRTLNGHLRLDLQYGSLTSRLGSAPFTFVQDGKLQEIIGDGAEIRINRSPDGKTQIVVLKGEIEVKTAAGGDRQASSKVRANEVLEFNQGEPASIAKKQQYELVEPQNNRTFWVAPGQPFEFNWRQTASITSGPMKFEISKDPDFNTPLVSEIVQGNSFSVPAEQLPTGVFHWRVLPADPNDASKVVAATAKVTLYHDLPPLPKFPENDQAFSPETGFGSKQVELMWENKSGSTEFEVQLASDESFSSILKSEKVALTNHLTPPLQAGEYYWRVRGLHPERKDSPWSQTMRFTVSPEGGQLPAPVLAQSSLQYVIPPNVLKRAPSHVSMEGQGVAPENIEPFQWSEVEGAQGYEVEIATTPDFVNPIKHSVGKTLSFAPQEVKPGSLYIRVRAIGEGGLQSSPSEVGKLDVSIPAPVLNTVEKAVDKFKTEEELKKGKHEFKLSWTPRPFAESYELEWGMDANFTRSKKFRTKGTRKALTVTRANDYAARVRALGPGGVPISSFSPVQVVSYRKELESSVVLKTAALQKGSQQAKAPASLLSNGLPGPILREPLLNTSFIAMEGSVPFVNFRWNKIANASHYEIQLAEDADFVNVVGTFSARSTRYTLKMEVPEGRVFWRVRAFINGTPTEWSQVRNINVLYQ